MIVPHPCMLLTREFWDTINFARGKKLKKLTPAPLASRETYSKRKAEFDEFVGYVASRPYVKVATHRELPELVELMPDAIPRKRLETDRTGTRKLSYYAAAGHYYMAAETFSILLDFFTSLLEGEKTGTNQGQVIARPTRRARAPPFKVEIDAFAETCRRLRDSLGNIEHVPSEICLGGHVTRPDTS